MTQIISDLFVNAMILIASVSVGNIILKKIQLDRISRIIFYGILYGILGCVLMVYSVHVSPTQIIDFRLIPIVLLALYSSPFSAITASLVIIIFRVVCFGLNAASVAAVIVAIIITTGCCIISMLKIRMSYKWIYSDVLIFTVVFISFVIMLDCETFWVVVTSYFTGIFIISISLFHLLKALSTTDLALEKATKEAKTDYLTGLLNLRKLNESLKTSINNAQEKNQNISVLYIDIDNFKRINDAYGHDEGDKVLKTTGRILLDICRNFDIVSRRGGDEFTVILVDCNLNQAKEIADRVQKKIEAFDYRHESGESYQVTVSIGISSYPETTSNDKKLMQQADAALYKAKRSGKNTYKTAEVKKL